MFIILTKDHIIPVAFGGSNEPDNIALVCQRCNAAKADQTLQEWYTTADPKIKLILDDLFSKNIIGSYKPFDPHNIDYSRPQIQDFKSIPSTTFNLESQQNQTQLKPLPATIFNLESQQNQSKISPSIKISAHNQITKPLHPINNQITKPVHCYLGPLSSTPPQFNKI